MTYEVITYGKGDTEEKIEGFFSDYQQAILFAQRTLVAQLGSLEKTHGEETCKELFTSARAQLAEHGFAKVPDYQIGVILESCDALFRKQDTEIEMIFAAVGVSLPSTLAVFINMDLLADIARGYYLLQSNPRLRSVRCDMPEEFLRDETMEALEGLCSIGMDEIEVTRGGAIYHLRSKYDSEYRVAYDIPIHER